MEQLYVNQSTGIGYKSWLKIEVCVDLMSFFFSLFQKVIAVYSENFSYDLYFKKFENFKISLSSYITTIKVQIQKSMRLQFGTS